MPEATPCRNCGRPTLAKLVCGNCRVKGIGAYDVSYQGAPVLAVETVIGDGTGGLELGRVYTRTVLAPTGREVPAETQIAEGLEAL